jgi:hypothetical protein
MKRIQIRHDHDHHYHGDLVLTCDEKEYNLPLTLTFTAYGGGSSSIEMGWNEAHRLRRAIDDAIAAEIGKGYSDFEQDQVEMFGWSS